MYACIILHNMIIEDKGQVICQYYEDDNQQAMVGPEERNAYRRAMESRETFHNLRADLVEHIWANRNR